MMSPTAKDEYRQVKLKLRNACSQRRIRLEEFMKTFDTHKTKKITTDQFSRAIDASGVRLSKKEVDLLLDKYRLKEDSRFVDYRRCCDLIDKACTTKNAEKSFKSKLKVDLTSQFDTFSLNEVDQEALRSIKEKLSIAIRTKGIVLKDVFHDFDKNNSGNVTKTRFTRDLCAIVVDVSQSEIDAIIKTYGQGLDVNYKQLHNDLMAVNFPSMSHDNNAQAQSRSPRSKRRISNQGSGADLEAIEGPMRDIVARDRIRIKNFFTDYDRMRSGKCTDSHFMRAVKVCFGALTEKDLSILIAAYGCPAADASNERKVDYLAFCKSVSSVHGDDELDNNIGLHVEAPIIPVAVCTRVARGDLSEDEYQCWQSLMSRLSHTVSTRRILLKPLFCDFDRGKTECVTCDQFSRVLAMFNMFLTTSNEQRAILKRYASTRLNTITSDKLPFDNKSYVNYKTFCLDLEEFQRNQTQRPTSPHQPSPFTGHLSKHEEIISESNTQRTLPMVLRYIKQKTKRDRIRLEEYFRDFDRLRKGKITRYQFASGLNTAGFTLSNDDITMLANVYKYKDENDVEGNSMVAWHRFVDEIESVFTVKGLEREPTRDIRQSIETAECVHAITDTMLNPSDEAIVLTTLQEMAQQISNQRLDIKPPFEDFDLSNQGFVSASKFERVLSMVNLLPAQASVTRLLVVKFSERGNAPHSGVSSTCDVNYRAFLVALESVKCTPDAQLLGAREFRLRQAKSTGEALLMENSRRHHKSPHQVTLASLLKDIRLQIDTKRIRFKQFFTESDRLRSGDITLAKFHTAINRSGLHVDGNDICTLNEAYKSSTRPDQINYRAFIADIESTVHVEDCRENTELSTASGEELERVLNRIRNAIQVRRLHMKPYFEDYDRNCRMHVTKTQFASVLDMMRMECTLSEISLLTSTYCVRHGREENPDVNYLRFIQDIDEGYSHLILPVGVKAAVKGSVK